MSPTIQQTVTVGTHRPFAPVFAVVAAGVAMSNLDVFIVNVALPEIGADYGGTSLAALSWILNAYAVVFAALLVPAGSIADRTGPRRAYLWGLGLFTGSSMACAAAPGVEFLVAARVLQAAGAAMIIPASLAILLTAAPPQRRVPAVRAWAALSGVAAALGPVAGGLLTQLDWRWVFLVNVPIGLIALIVGRRVLPPVAARPSAGKLDHLGAVLLTVGVAALALGVVKSDDWGWRSIPVLVSLTGAGILLAWFARRCARHPAPVLPLPILRVPTVSPATLASLLFAVAFGAMLLSVVFWCQEIWQWSPLRTGLAIAPGPLMVPLISMGVGPVARRIGAGTVAAAGCLFFGAGVGWWAYRLGATPEYATGLLPGMLLTGIGVGLTLPTLVSTAVAALPPQSFATGSAVVTMARQIGSVLGVALLVVVLPGQRERDVFADYDLGWYLTIAATVATALVCLLIRPRAAR